MRLKEITSHSVLKRPLPTPTKKGALKTPVKAKSPTKWEPNAATTTADVGKDTVKQSQHITTSSAESNHTQVVSSIYKTLQTFRK